MICALSFSLHLQRVLSSKKFLHDFFVVSMTPRTGKLVHTDLVVLFVQPNSQILNLFSSKKVKKSKVEDFLCQESKEI